MRNLRYLLSLGLLSALPFLSISEPNPQSSAELKMRNVEMNRWPHNRAISFTAPELVALGMSEITQDAPGAVSRPALQLRNGAGVASALVNFDRLQKAKRTGSGGSDWLLSKLLSGQHDVTVSVEITSGNGMMTVHPTAVNVGGATASGATLDFLVNHFVVPYYPQAVINRPFRLAKNIDRIVVTPAGATVYRK
jgi:hypothetical protein